MKRVIKYAVLLLVLVLSYLLFKPVFSYGFGWKPFSIAKISAEKQHSNPMLQSLDSVLISSYKELKTPAVSIAIYKNDSLLWNNSIGFSDIESSKKITSDTKLRIGSVSKALTSGGLGVLLENNSLNIQTKVSDVFPDKYLKLANVTVEQLASHTAGIRNYGAGFSFPIWEYYNDNQYNSVAEAVSVFVDDELLFEQKSDFSYSTYNTVMLSLLLEKTANTNFSSLMNEKVFSPLQMQNTSAEEKGNVATFYLVEDDEYKEAPYVNNSNKIAGGGFVSTATDLAKFGSAILHNQLFSEATKQQLFTPVKLTNGKVNEQNYGLGWRIDKTKKIFADKRDVKIVHHGGVAMGSTAFLLLLPEYNISTAITINSNIENGSGELSRVLYKIIEKAQQQ